MEVSIIHRARKIHYFSAKKIDFLPMRAKPVNFNFKMSLYGPKGSYITLCCLLPLLRVGLVL